MKTTKEEVTGLLKTHPGISTSTVANLLEENYWKILSCLVDLELLNQVERVNSTKKRNYWRLKK